MSSRNRTNFAVDAVVFVAFVLAMVPRITGNPVHEWISLAIVAAVVAHLVLHWEWIIGTGGRLFEGPRHRQRLLFAVDLAFFVALAVLTMSGIALSRAAMPAIGVRFPFSMAWKQTHRIAAEVALITLAVHCGLHERWIAESARSCILDPVIGIFRGRHPASDAGRAR